MKYPERWQNFVEDYKPAADAHLAQSGVLEADKGMFPNLRQKQIEQGLLGVEHTLDEVVPRFDAHYGDLPEARGARPDISNQRVPADTPSGKASLRDEDPRYMAQEYVYAADLAPKKVKAIEAVVMGDSRLGTVGERTAYVERMQAARTKAQAIADRPQPHLTERLPIVDVGPPTTEVPHPPSPTVESAVPTGVPEPTRPVGDAAVPGKGGDVASPVAAQDPLTLATQAAPELKTPRRAVEWRRPTEPEGSPHKTWPIKDNAGGRMVEVTNTDPLANIEDRVAIVARKGSAVGDPVWRVERNALYGEDAATRKIVLAKGVTLDEGHAIARGMMERPILERTPIAPRSPQALGIVSEDSRKAMAAWDALTVPKPLRVSAVPDVGYETANLTPRLRDHVVAGRMEPQTAHILMTEVQVGKDLRPLYDVYDGHVIGGMTEREAAAATLAQVMAADARRMGAGKARQMGEKALKAWDVANQFTREGIQYNITSGLRGSISDLLGDSVAQVITGHPEAIATQLRGFRSTLRATRSMRPEDIAKIPENGLLQDLGTTVPQRYLPGGMHAAGAAVEHGSGPMTIERFGNWVGGPARPAGKGIGFFLQNRLYRDLRNTLDSTRRGSLYVSVMGKDLGEAEGAFWRRATIDAGTVGADPAQWRAQVEAAAQARVPEGRAWTGTFSPDDVRTGTGDEGLARAWRQEVGTLERKARAETDRVLFSYEKTKLDEGVGRAVYFSYWTTRALALHTGALLHNPFLINLYAEAYDAIGKEAAANGYPPGMTHMAKFMGDTVAGHYGLVNPVNIFTAFQAFADMGNPNASLTQKVGVFLSPWIRAGQAAMGGGGDVPDVLGATGPFNMLSAIGSYLDAHNLTHPGFQGGRPMPNYVRAVEQRGIEGANAAARWLGLTADEYRPNDQAVGQTVKLRAIVEHNAVQAYGPADGWTPQQKSDVADAIAKAQVGDWKSNPLTAAAYKEFADAVLYGRVASLVVPGGVQMRYAPLDQARQLSKDGYAAIDGGGKPTPEQQAAMGQMKAVDAGSPEDIKLQTQQENYRKIGTVGQQSLGMTERDIVFSKPSDFKDPMSAIQIGSQWYMMSDINRLPQADRQLLADRWVAEQGGTADLKAYGDEQKKFKADNPAYADYTGYLKTVSAHTGSETGFRDEMAGKDPNFGRALKDQTALLEGQGKSGDVLKNELDKWTRSLAGFEAYTGVQSSIYQQEPIATLDTSKLTPSDLQGGGAKAAAGGPKATTTKKGTEQQLLADQKRYAVDSAIVDQALSGMGIPGGVSSISNPYMTPWLKAQFGTALPRKTQMMTLFDEWVRYQPPNADKSPKAFAAYVDGLSYQSNPAA